MVMGSNSPFFVDLWKCINDTVYVVDWTKNNQVSILTAAFGFLLQGSYSGRTGMLLSHVLRQLQWVEEDATLSSKTWKLAPGLMDWLWIIWKRGLFGRMHGSPSELSCCVQKYSHLIHYYLMTLHNRTVTIPWFKNSTWISIFPVGH